MPSLVERLVQEGMLAIAILALVIGSLEIGFRLGRRRADRGGSAAVASAQIGAIQGALLGLVGLLLGFSFAAAASRFLERQDLIVRDANAIGTAHLRADLLPPPYRDELKRALEGYAEHRIDSEVLFGAASPRIRSEFAAFHKRIWDAARDGVRAEPSATVVVLDAANEVIDVHALRISAGRKHLPPLVLGLLFGASGLALLVIGYGCGLVRDRKAPMSVPLAVLIAAALWTTIDLDHPRRGLLRLSDAPLVDLGFGVERRD